jgi:hypothetical protein
MQYLYGLYFLIILLLIVIFFPYIPVLHNCQEMFSNYNLNNAGILPDSETLPLLYDSYPLTGSKSFSNKNYGDIWWEYPIFPEPSFKQITNNLRYRRNPDDGTCIRADFCDALYKNIENKPNYIYPLPPAPLVTPNSVRVNYYLTDPPKNLFLGNQAGPELQAFAN